MGKKRQFDGNRYPGYVHKMTGRARSAAVAAEEREYVFFKIEPPTELPLTIYYKSPATLKEHYVGTPHHDSGHVLPELSTDNSSETYSTDSSEEDNDLLYRQLSPRSETILNKNPEQPVYSISDEYVNRSESLNVSSTSTDLPEKTEQSTPSLLVKSMSKSIFDAMNNCGDKDEANSLFTHHLSD